MKNTFYFLLTAVLLSTSCSIKKRAYMPGYHVEWAFAKKKQETIHPLKESKNVLKKENEVAEEVVVAQPIDRHEIFSPSTKKTTDADPINIHRNSFSGKKDTCNDLISFRNGNEIKGKVIEINETQIKYKRCDNIDGPMMIVSKNEVAFVKYSNGQSETFVKDAAEVKKTKPSGPLPMHPMALAAVIFTIAFGACLFLGILGSLLLWASAGFFISLATIFSITGVSFADVAKKRLKTKEMADQYSGLNEAKSCFIINWVYLGLLILSFLIVLYLIFSFII